MIRTHLVSATVVTEEPELVARAAEMLQRVATGLALEGITVRMDFTSYDMEDEEDEEADAGADPAGDRETPEA